MEHRDRAVVNKASSKKEDREPKNSPLKEKIRTALTPASNGQEEGRILNKGVRAKEGLRS